MKLYAQYGYGDGNKIFEALGAGYIEGVILRPRDLSPDKLVAKLNAIKSDFPNCDLFFDPQAYAGILATEPNASFGKLQEYPYFSRLQIGQLEKERNCVDLLRRVFDYVSTLDVQPAIAPNIVIRRSFDSREAVVAKNMIRLTKELWQKKGGNGPVYATLAISRDALVNQNELQEFLNEMTSMDKPPDGFYLLIAGRSSEARSEMFHADVIAGWMLIVHSLNINGFHVVNGYSDIFSLLIAAVGASAGATGWYSNTRNFSMDQFMITSGGRLPVQRYLSARLLNRIRFDELSAWRTLVPEVVNGYTTDSIFESGEEPDRTKEVFQSWETIRNMIAPLDRINLAESLDLITSILQEALVIYGRIESYGLPIDVRSNRDHLEPMMEGIRIFRNLAEV